VALPLKSSDKGRYAALLRAFKPVSGGLAALVLLCKQLSGGAPGAAVAEQWAACVPHLAGLPKAHLVHLAAWLLLEGGQPVAEEAVGRLEAPALQPAVQLQVLDDIMQVRACSHGAGAVCCLLLSLPPLVTAEHARDHAPE
jgi:hypothetical protein